MRENGSKDFKLGRCYERGLVFGVLIRLMSAKGSSQDRSQALTLLAEATKILERDAPLGVGVGADDSEDRQ